MNNAKRKIEISLLGQRFTVRSEKNESHVHALAEFVTKQLETVRRQTKTVSTHHLSLLVALNLADQMFQKDEKLNLTQQKLKVLISGTIKNIDTAIDSLAQKGKSGSTI